jgi:Uma2 family endonuclease
MNLRAARRLSLFKAVDGPDGRTHRRGHQRTLRTQPRSAWPHGLAGSRLGADIENSYGSGRGGPGGSWIIDEAEVHFVLDLEVTVPDIVGWRNGHMPSPPEGREIQVVTDRICEIFLPSTKSTYREEKLPLYARYGVRFAWLVDPNA